MPGTDAVNADFAAAAAQAMKGGLPAGASRTSISDLLKMTGGALPKNLTELLSKFKGKIGGFGGISGIVMMLMLPMFIGQMQDIWKKGRGTDLESQQIDLEKSRRRDALLANAMVLADEASNKKRASMERYTDTATGVSEAAGDRQMMALQSALQLAGGQVQAGGRRTASDAAMAAAQAAARPPSFDPSVYPLFAEGLLG